MNTPTPRTDYNEFHPDGDGGCVGSWFARQLECELTDAIKQRDALAEDLKQIYNVSLFDYDTMPEAARKKYREVVFAIADKALQFLNQPTEL